MSNAHDFVTSFMKNLAGEVELTEALQTVFAKILAAQVTVDADVVNFKPAFSTLLKVLTFIATPQDKRPEAGSDYTQEEIDAAANSAATETSLTLGEEIPTEAPSEEPTEAPSEEPTEAPSEEPTDPELPEGETISLTTGTDQVRPSNDEDFVEVPVVDEEGNPVVDEEGNPVVERELSPAEGVQFTTENNDTIVGAVETLATRSTLDRTDLIDGGEGRNTLEVALNANFGGFQGDGGLQNVQVVELTNGSSSNRTWNAEGIEGVEHYILNTTERDIRLNRLEEAGIRVDLNGQEVGRLQLDFQASALRDADDSLTLGLTNVGTTFVAADCGRPNTAVDAKYIEINTTSGIENLALDLEGSNWINLDAATSTVRSLTITGSGELRTENGINNQIRTIDASAYTGDIAVDGITAALVDFSSNQLTSLKLGDGTNAVLANSLSKRLAEIEMGNGGNSVTTAANGLSTTARVEGGEGQDTLNIEGNNAAFRLNMTNVETLQAAGITFTGTQVEGLQNVVHTGGDLTLADMQTTELNLTLGNEVVSLARAPLTTGTTPGAVPAGEVVYDGFGSLNVDTWSRGPKYDCEGDFESNRVSYSNTDVKATNASELVFNVADYSVYGGDIYAIAAESIELNVGTGRDQRTFEQGGADQELTDFRGELIASVAGDMSINSEGLFNGTITSSTLEEITGTFARSDITLNTENLGSAVLTFEERSIINKNSELNNLSVLNAEVNGTGAVGKNSSLFVETNLDNLQEATFTGTGTGIDLTANGSTVAGESETVEINASTFLGNFQVSVDSYTIENESDAGSAAVTGSSLGVNHITIGEGRAETLVNGGVQQDIVTVDINVNNFLIEGDLGLGKDIVDLTVNNSIQPKDNEDKPVDVQFTFALLAGGAENTLKIDVGNLQGGRNLVATSDSIFQGYNVLDISHGTLDITQVELDNFGTFANVKANTLKISASQVTKIKALETGTLEIVINTEDQAKLVKDYLTNTDSGLKLHTAAGVSLSSTQTNAEELTKINKALGLDVVVGTELVANAAAIDVTKINTIVETTNISDAHDFAKEVEEKDIPVVKDDDKIDDDVVLPKDAFFTATETLAVTGNDDAQAHVMEIDLGAESFTATTAEDYTLTVGSVELTATTTVGMTSEALITALTTGDNATAYDGADFTIAAGKVDDNGSPGTNEAIVITWKEAGVVTSPGTVSLASLDVDFSSAVTGADVTEGQDETFTSDTVTFDLAAAGDWSETAPTGEALEGYVFQLADADDTVLFTYTVEFAEIAGATTAADLTLDMIAAELSGQTATGFTLAAGTGSEITVENTDVSEASSVEIELTGYSTDDWAVFG